MTALKWLADRLKEASSWAGISILAAAVGAPAGLVDPAVQILIGVGGVISFLLKDKAAS